MDFEGHSNAGLLGPLLVGRRGALASGTDVINLLHVVNEAESPFLQRNLAGRNGEGRWQGLGGGWTRRAVAPR